ncbi:MAG: glycoside hydrolase [Deltaproteobacteria bacterium]|nr:glycoside hydrolase [Deltaproteobacteria bacterium]
MPIAFYWHMHQPYYKDPLSGLYSLPWVRLHAVKGYYDMISLLEEYPAIRQTFNLVPSLLSQLEDYARGKGHDLFLEHTRRPAADLSPEEKRFLLANFFMCNRETMIRPYPAYWALLQKRGQKNPGHRWEDLVRRFTTQELLDLQVWFNLCWFGHRAVGKKPVVAELRRKGRFFSEEDKAALLKAQAEIVKEVIPLYQAALARGQVELTVSPFYHPILPLLIDSSHASRAMPQASLPPPFVHPEDAKAQIERGVDYFRRLFGQDPRGLWPSEGSVSPELIPLVKEAGIRWMFSDEGILFRSLSQGNGRAHLYQPYRVRHQGAEVAMVFRDRNLSDLIGFTYANNPPASAGGDLLSHLENIHRSLSDPGERLVLIALDGENPWEGYPDGGQGFLRVLYERLSNHPLLTAVKVGEHLEAHPPRPVLEHLFTGSWIDQNFRIWIGHPEDNQAWNALRRTRQVLEKSSAQAPLPPEKLRLAWEEIYIAEGSDWFWWYGDDFSSQNDAEFDRLFRLHLGNVHLLLDQPVPEYLKEPIALPRQVEPAIEPVGLISPVIDGRITHFYEWLEAGFFAPRFGRGAMHQAENHLSGLHYGFDLENLYFRLDPPKERGEPLPGLVYELQILTPRAFLIRFPLVFPEEEEQAFSLFRCTEEGYVFQRRLPMICARQIIELAVPHSELNLKPREKVDFFLRVRQGELELERLPRSGFLSLVVPDRDFELSFWRV